MDNCLNTFLKLLKCLKVKHTKAYAKDTILSHPDYPSMLAISDALEKYNIECYRTNRQGAFSRTPVTLHSTSNGQKG
ncbi:hypothetical protein OOZ15_19340 [Galbibacter sp. EGI 63066]|uniref:hypothetical protein n=1 Tax=Galbibacter sp. EGI 63066 TaxID=2993559 RepID=UPI0022489DF2|nr:hypothetical protein [Galbibacter sp. EGI 63066]MCX2682113.1 hypothetical protein [Galbibacter sp. EGI 63066]